jgi:ferritin
MMSAKIEKGINDQVNLELFSSYTYMAMSAYFSAMNLEGFARWMRLQAQEELGHALKLFDYVLERDGNVKLAAVKAPTAAWKSPLAACENALKHEQMNTKEINTLMNLATTEKDHATRIFLQWFVQEQVEEESTALKLVEKLRLVRDNSGALFILDQELGRRQTAE